MSITTSIIVFLLLTINYSTNQHWKILCQSIDSSTNVLSNFDTPERYLEHCEIKEFGGINVETKCRKEVRQQTAEEISQILVTLNNYFTESKGDIDFKSVKSENNTITDLFDNILLQWNTTFLMPYWDYRLDLALIEPKLSSILKLISKAINLTGEEFISELSANIKALNEIIILQNPASFSSANELIELFESNNTTNRIEDVLRIFLFVSIDIGIKEDNNDNIPKEYCQQLSEWLEWSELMQKCVALQDFSTESPKSETIIDDIGRASNIIGVELPSTIETSIIEDAVINIITTNATTTSIQNLITETSPVKEQREENSEYLLLAISAVDQLDKLFNNVMENNNQSVNEIVNDSQLIDIVMSANGTITEDTPINNDQELSIKAINFLNETTFLFDNLNNVNDTIPIITTTTTTTTTTAPLVERIDKLVERKPHRKHKKKHKIKHHKSTPSTIYSAETVTSTTPSALITAVASTTITTKPRFLQSKKFASKYKPIRYKYEKEFEKSIDDELSIKPKNKMYDNYHFEENKYSQYNTGKYPSDYVNEAKKNFPLIEHKLEEEFKEVNSEENADPNNNLDRLLKYFIKTRLPKGTILWKTKHAPIPLVYFTITVVKGPLTRRGKPPFNNKRRVRNAHIYLMGLNMPTGYTQVTEGYQIKNSNTAVVRTLNPETSGPFVEFKIRVENKYGSSCKQMCLDHYQRYRRCARKVVRLSTFKKFSDPIPYYQTSVDAIDAQWTGRGYYKKRKYDHLLFRCD